MDFPSQLRMTPLHGSTSRKKLNEIVFKKMKSEYTEIELMLENCLNDDSKTMDEVKKVLVIANEYRDNCQIIKNMFNHLVAKHRDYFEDLLIDILTK